MAKYAGTPEFHMVYGELVLAARYHGLTTYQRVARIGRLPETGNNMGKEVGLMLGEIVRQEVKEGRPMLSAVCVSASGKASEGFFGLAEELRKFDPKKQSKDDFWKAELAAVYATYWQRK